MPTDVGDEDAPSKANTKAEIVDAAHAAELLDVTDDGGGWTKAELLDLWK